MANDSTPTQYYQRIKKILPPAQEMQKNYCKNTNPKADGQFSNGFSHNC
jgi:hypothetical protein